jgi:hypothetical protein
MPELLERAPRERKARSQKKSSLPPTGGIAPCGRSASSTEPFFSIRFEDGTVFVQSAAALERGGFCPDCVADELVRQGYARYGRPMIAPYDSDSELDLPVALNVRS